MGPSAQRGQDEVAEPAERRDLRRPVVDVTPAMAEQERVQADVLGPGEILVEAGPQLEQGSDAPAHLDAPARRPQDVRDHLEERALAGAVRSDDPHALPAMDRARHTVFSAAFGFPIEHYAVYALSGILFWNFFQQSVISAMNSLARNASILRKLPVPKAVLVKISMLRHGSSMLQSSPKVDRR